MKANKDMTDREFVYSINLKRAMNLCTSIQQLLDDASDVATSDENEYLHEAEMTLNFLRNDVAKALRHMSVDS